MPVMKFYNATDNLGELSNFYVHAKPLLWDGATFATSEHLYHFQKYHYPGASVASLEYANIIRTASTPFKAKILANQILLSRFAWQKSLHSEIMEYKNKGVKPREDWDNIKTEMMRKCVLLKFTQDEHCKRVLLSTLEYDLVEASSRDSFWGAGSDGKGLNYLGKILGQVRRELLIEQEVQALTDLWNDNPEAFDDEDLFAAPCLGEKT